jgi:hypothetical protein
LHDSKLKNLLFQPQVESAEKVDVQQIQAINPRAIRVAQQPLALKHETFADARAVWLNIVMLGLLLLGAASVLAVLGAWHDAARDIALTKLRMGFVAGPGAPKLWVLSEMLRTPSMRYWALASLVLYCGGVLAAMWPERVGIMGLAGIGRLIASVMAVAALIFGLDLLREQPSVPGLLHMSADELLTWLIFLDMAAMILVNMRVAGIAGRGGYHALAKLVGGMLAVQVGSILMLIFSLNVEHSGMGLMFASAGTYACGGVGVMVVGAFLVMRIAWELLSRHLHASKAAHRTPADDWDDPSK